MNSRNIEVGGTSLGSRGKERKQSEDLFCLVVAGAFGLNIQKQRFRNRAKYGPFVWYGRVKDCVGTFLEGEYIVLFASANGSPSVNGFFGRVTSVFAVSYCASDQACVSGADSIVVVDYQLSQSTDINFKLVVCRHRAGKLVIQAVYAFDNNDLVIIDAHRHSFILAAARVKIEFGNLRNFAFEQFTQMSIEEWQI